VSVNRNVFRAGIIPYIRTPENQIKFMFMQPSDPTYGGSEWQMAKGRVENDDDNFTTALREGAEELGLKESNIKSITELGLYLGRTTVYICEVTNIDDFDDYTFETGAIKWLSHDEFQQSGRQIHKPIVSDALKLIVGEN